MGMRLPVENLGNQTLKTCEGLVPETVESSFRTVPERLVTGDQGGRQNESGPLH